MRNVVTPGRLSNTRVVYKYSRDGFEIYRAAGVMDALERLDDIIDATKAEQLVGLFFTAARLVADAVRAASPDPSDATIRKGWQSIRDAVFTGRGDRTESNVLVGVSHTRAPQALWFEYGTQPRSTSKGAARGQMSPKPFFRPAINAVRDAVAQVLVEGIRAVVEKES